ncbi:MAG: hypothetical protein ACODAQ_10920, partial [Phycisphaeraceae bacterium]
MSRCRCTLLLAAALAGLAGVGCAAERVEPTAMEATFPPIDGERLLPLAPRAMRVRVVEGPNAGDELDYQVQRADDGDHWLFTLEGAQ